MKENEFFFENDDEFDDENSDYNEDDELYEYSTTQSDVIEELQKLFDNIISNSETYDLNVAHISNFVCAKEILKYFPNQVTFLGSLGLYFYSTPNEDAEAFVVTSIILEVNEIRLITGYYEDGNINNHTLFTIGHNEKEMFNEERMYFINELASWLEMVNNALNSGRVEISNLLEDYKLL